MAAPAIYLDECVRRRLAVSLRSRGFRVTTTWDERMLGASDMAQLDYATGKGLAIMSHNARDFRALHRRYSQQNHSHGGIILMPYTSVLALLEARTAMMLDWIGMQPEYLNRLFRWNDVQYWLSQGNRLAGYTEDEVRLALGQRS
jgi:hypothetical protein